ncbi:MAG: outer membrane beta-barrel protein [Tidjanibacter sp.]|nr:outer membrane beta-barrel protein [Tidjanibacter sp.]
MKKLFLSFAVVMLGLTAVSAQSEGNFFFGPKAGLTTDMQDVKFTTDGAKEVWDGSQNYNAGIMFRANLPLSIFSLHLQPELMYHWQKGQFTKDDGTTKFEPKGMTINSFSIPILAGAGIDLGLFNARIQVGPTIKFNSQATFEGGEGNKIDWKDVSYTWAAGAGIDLFSFIMIDFRYLGGWNEGQEPTKFTELFEFERINKDTKTWNISIGLMF